MADRTIITPSGEVVDLSTDRDAQLPSGIVVSHEVAAAGAYTLTADTVAYTETGTDAGVTAARKLTADTNSYSETAQDAGVTAARNVTADTVAYTETGQDVTLTYVPFTGA